MDRHSCSNPNCHLINRGRGGRGAAGSQRYSDNPYDYQTGYYNPVSYIFYLTGLTSTAQGSSAKKSVSATTSGKIYQQLIGGIKTHFDHLKTSKTPKISETTKLTIEEFYKNYDGLMSILTDENLLLLQHKDEIASKLGVWDDSKDEPKAGRREDKAKSDQKPDPQNMAFELSKSESAFENISIRTRPTVVAEKYEHICSSEWHSAKVALDSDPLKEEDKLGLLSNILRVSEEVAKEAKDSATKRLDKLINDPLDPKGGQSDAMQSADDSELVRKLHIILGDVWRQGSGDVNVNNLVEEVRKRTTQQQPDKILKALKHQEVVTYLEECVRISWMMVLQRPPMEFQKWEIPRKYDATMEEPAWGSDDPGDPKVQVKCIMYPALYQRDYLMVKGKVLLKKT